MKTISLQALGSSKEFSSCFSNLKEWKCATPEAVLQRASPAIAPSISAGRQGAATLVELTPRYQDQQGMYDIYLWGWLSEIFLLRSKEASFYMQFINCRYKSTVGPKPYNSYKRFSKFTEVGIMKNKAWTSDYFA